MPWLLSTEIWLCLLALTVLAVDLSVTPERCKSLLGTLVPAGLAAALLVSGPALGTAWAGVFVQDEFAVVFKTLFLLAAIIAALMTRHYLRREASGHGASYLLLVLATCGMCFLASAGDLVMMFVSLELITFSFYVMTVYMKTDRRSIEAGLKYLLMGSVATGCLVYGAALVYGLTGSTRFADIAAALHAAHPTVGLTIGLLLLLAGVGFKTAAVPFHAWVPDVYEGAPTPVVAFLSVGSKAAGFAILMRIVLSVTASAAGFWTTVIGMLAAASMCYGNLAAIPQTNFKRLLGYSSIGHGGYLLMGLAAGSALGASAMTFYLLAYLFTNLAAFIVLLVVSDATGSDELQAIAGLSRRSPFLAAALFVALLSLAGVPPLAGFFGKFWLLLSTVQRGLVWLAAVGAVNVVISLYYYLRVVKRAYIDAPDHTTPLATPVALRLTLAVCVVGIIGIGIWQGPFVKLAETAVASLFS